jgi:hypothetical protein
MSEENIVYHYTSLNALFNIIERQVIWLTDLHSSMDINEMKYGEEIIKLKGEEMLGIKTSRYLSAHKYYALSCTAYNDSYFHFNNYGDSCKGVAIGINANFIEDSLGCNCANLLRDHLHFSKVLYDKAKFVKGIVDCLNVVKEESDNAKRESQLAMVYNCYNACLKRPEFELEHEIRFTYCQDYRGRRIGSAKKLNGEEINLFEFISNIGLEEYRYDEECPKLKYNCFGNRIRKYYEMSLKEFGINNIIKSVVIGPKSKQSKSELEKYLFSKGLTAKVIESKIKLRD